MVVELQVQISPYTRYLHITPVFVEGREVGFIDEIISHIDGDVFLCLIALNEEYKKLLTQLEVESIVKKKVDNTWK